MIYSWKKNGGYCENKITKKNFIRYYQRFVNSDIISRNITNYKRRIEGERSNIVKSADCGR